MPLSDAKLLPLAPSEFGASISRPDNLRTLQDAQIAGSTQIARGWESADLSGRVGDLYTQANAAYREGRYSDGALLEAQARDLSGQAAQWAPRVQNVTDVRSLRDAADWTMGALGNARTSVEPAIGGLIGAGVGTLAAPFTAGIVNPLTAGFAGAALAGGSSERNEAMAGAMTDPQIRATKSMDEINEAALVKGAVNSVLEAAVPTVLGGKVLTGAGIKALVRQTVGRAATEGEKAAAKVVEQGVKRAIVDGGLEAAVKTVAKEQAKEALGEFATEGTQSLVGQATQNHLKGEPLSNLDYGQAFNEAAAGAVSGHASGTVGGLAEVGHAYAGVGGQKVADIKKDPAGALADGVADAMGAAGKIGAQALNWYERASSPPHRAFDALVGTQAGASDDVMGARAMQWAGHVLQTRDSTPEEVAAAKDFVLAQSKGDDNAWRTYRDKLTIEHHEARNAAADQGIADEFNGGKPSLMKGTLTDDFGEQEGRDPSDDGVVDNYGTRVRSGMDGADAAAHAELSQIGQPVLPRQDLATRGAGLPTLETTADIWRKQGVSDKLLTATSDKTDPAQRQMAIGLLGWVARGFKDADGEVFVPESLTKRYGVKAPKMIQSAAKLAFEQGLIGHDEARMTPQIMQMAQLQHADATAVDDAVLGALPEYARDLYKPHLEDLKKLLRKVAAEGATKREEAALLDAFGSKEAVAQAMSKLPDPQARYGGKVPGSESTATQVVRDAEERVEGGVDFESNLDERAPETRVTYKGQGGKDTPFNTLHEHQQSNLTTALSTLQNDPGVFARPVGVYDAIKEQYSADHPYRREAENEALWRAVKKMTSTSDERTQYLADIEKLSDAEREQQLRALNRTHKLLRVEQATEEVADQIRPDQVEGFREKRGERSKDVTAQQGMLYLERKAQIDKSSGEMVGKDENFLTSTARLLAHMNAVENRGSDGRTVDGAGNGAKGSYEKMLRGLAALIASDNTFTGRVGFRSSPEGEIKWYEQGVLPNDLKIAGTNKNPTTVEQAQRAAASERRNEPVRSKYAVKYVESLKAKVKELQRQVNLAPKSLRAKEIAQALRSGSAAVEAMYTKLRNQWDGTADVVGDAIDSERPSNRDDIVPSEHRGDEPIYRNADGARIGLGTDAEGAGYEGHAARSEKAERSADGPQPTLKAENKATPAVEPSERAMEWAFDVLHKKGVPAYVAALKKLSQVKLKIAYRGLERLLKMSPASVQRLLDATLSSEEISDVLTRASTTMMVLKGMIDVSDMSGGYGDVRAISDEGRIGGVETGGGRQSSALERPGRAPGGRDAVQTGDSSEAKLGTDSTLRPAIRDGSGKTPEGRRTTGEDQSRAVRKPDAGTTSADQKALRADDVEPSVRGRTGNQDDGQGHREHRSVVEKLQAYLNLAQGKNAALAGALRREIERLDAGGKPTGNTTGALAAAAKQFGELGEKTPSAQADPTDRLLKTFTEPFVAAKTPREKINVIFNELKSMLADHTEPGAFGHWRLTNTGDGKVATAKYLDALFKAEMGLRDKMSDKQASAVSEMGVKLFRAFNATYGVSVSDVLDGKQNAQTADLGTGKRSSKEAVAAAKQHILDTLGDSVKLAFVKHFGDNSSGMWTPGATQNTITLALNGDVLGTAYHESMHEFFSQLGKVGDAATQVVLKRVATNGLLLRKLEILLKDHPEAAAQLRADPEEAVAFMYQFWRAGLLKLGPETQTFFEKVKAFFAQIHGRVSKEVRDAQHAEAILAAFSNGALKDDATRETMLQQMRESSEAHEAALERADKAGRDMVRRFGKLLFSSEAMMKATKNTWMRSLAEDFNQESGTAKGVKQALFDATKQQMNIWTNRLDNILNGSDEFGMKYTKDDFELARQALASGKPAKDRVAKELVAKIEAFNEAMFKYISERGVSRWDDEARAWVPVEHRKDYFRRVWNTDAVREGADQFRAMLLEHHMKELESIAREANGELARNEMLDPGFASQIMKAKPAAEQTLITPEHVADAIIARLLNANGQIELSESTSSLGMTPVATSVNRRSLSWIDAGKFDAFLSHDLINIMSGYVASMVKRAEHTRVFGVGAEKLKAKVDKAVLQEMAGDKLVSEAESALPAAVEVWRKAARAAHETGVPFDEPYPTLRSVGQKAHFAKVGFDQGLKDLNKALTDLDQGMKAVMAMEGTLGADIAPALRQLNSMLMTYQTLRVLPLVLFSSINDIMGIVAQDGGTLNDAWHAFVAGMREIRLRWKDEKSDTAASRRAEEWGTVDAGSFLDTLGQTYGSMYFTGKAKRLSDTFFKWNGMEAWNRATRITASAVAERAIKALKTNGIDASDKAAAARVEALFGKGFDVKNIKLDAEGNLDASDPANQAAMMRWVSNAIMSPNAAHRTIWGSDTRMASFWMLKQFAYTFQRVMLKNAVAQAKLGNYRPAMVLALGYAPVAIAADAVKEMLVPGDEPPWMKMGLGAYLQHGLDRAGIFGVPGMIYDSVSYDYGVGLLGPTVGQIAHLPFDPVDESLVGALPAGGRLKKLVQD